MKDLYKRLHVLPTATDAEIRAALLRADPDSRAAAEYILLDPARRKVYDRHHRLLTTIAHLRSRLALGLRPFWSHGQHHDFNVAMTARKTPEHLDAMRVMQETSWQRQGRVRWLLVTLGIAAAAAFALVIWLIHRICAG